MIILPLGLLLLSRGILANQTPLTARNGQCFSTTVSGSQNYNACCSSVKAGIDGLTDAEGAPQMFHYVCDSYMVNNKYIGNVNSVRACAEACATSASCRAGAWDSSNSACVMTSDTDPEYAADNQKSYVRFVKVSESDLPPVGTVECDDQVSNAKLACENEQEEKCRTRMETQKEDLDSQCDQRVEDRCKQSDDDETTAEQCEDEKSVLEKTLRSQCEVEKDKAAKQWKKDQAAKDAQDRKARNELENRLKQLQKQEAEDKKKAEEDKKALEKLQQENKQLQQRVGRGTSTQRPTKQSPTAKPNRKQPPKPSGQNQVYNIPSLNDFEGKCSDFKGQEYTVMGITYEVFCGRHPDDGVKAKREWISRNPSFLMGICSTTPGCQGIKLRENFAQLSFTHDFPPSKDVEQKYWSLVPKEPRADNDVTDVRSQFMDDRNGVRCPEVDGQVATLGDRSYRLSCRKGFNVNRAKEAHPAKNLNECLVSCYATKKCQGVMRLPPGGDYYCANIFVHYSLPAETPEKDLSEGDTWVAMLTEA